MLCSGLVLHKTGCQISSVTCVPFFWIIPQPTNSPLLGPGLAQSIRLFPLIRVNRRRERDLRIKRGGIPVKCLAWGLRSDVLTDKWTTDVGCFYIVLRFFELLIRSL